MSMSAFARDIAARLHHRACLIDEGSANVAADLRDIAAINLADLKPTFATRCAEIVEAYGFEPVEQSKPFAYADGVAIIPIHGMLINRMSWSYSFATGYNFIRSQMEAALADDDVKLIVYDINSSGGLASGCSELSQEIFDSRAVKPSLSVVDSRCYSAAYFLGSAATRIVVTPSGGVGSIGAACMHVDYSDMVEAEGLKVTFIVSGARKVEGNPYERLSKSARATIQRDVDYHAGLFIGAVVRNRDLSEETIRGTEAGIFLPPEALDLGLIDAIETPAEAVASFYNDLTSDAEGDDETMTTAAIAAAAAAAAPVPAAPLQSGTAPAVPTMTQADIQAMVAAGVTEALTAQRTRASGIRTCEEAAGRAALANHLADNTAMTVDEARAILAVSPKEAPVKPANGFAHAMATTANPEVGADAGGGEPGDKPTPEATADRLLANYVSFTGRKVLTIEGKAA